MFGDFYKLNTHDLVYFSLHIFLFKFRLTSICRLISSNQSGENEKQRKSLCKGLHFKKWCLIARELIIKFCSTEQRNCRTGFIKPLISSLSAKNLLL